MDAMAIAGVAMQGDLRRLETISHNVANVLTPGFKRQVALSPGFAQQLQVHGIAKPEQAATYVVDAASGPLRPTGSQQDVAIEGEGFFEVATASGRAYSRQGSLHADSQGRLVGTHGFPVLGEGGEISLTGAPFTVAANGDVQQGGRIVGRLKIVNFDTPSALQPSGAGLYTAGAAQLRPQRSGAVLRPGFIEGSNVSTPQEMVRLSETVRHFESLQKVVQGYDETLEKAIRKLGDF
jgi:flagellar basal-body rod protein FlgF